MTKLTKKEKYLYSILVGAEELIENLDMKGKDKKLGKVYKFLHGFNTEHSCYKVHGDWRDEFESFVKKKEHIKVKELIDVI
jgi:hypothetical protein